MATRSTLTPRAQKMHSLIEKYLFLNGKITQKAFSQLVHSFLSGGFMLSILTFLFKIVFNLFQSGKNLLN
jgi:hypothetical protein